MKAWTKSMPKNPRRYMKEAKKATMAAISESDTTWRGVELRIFSLQRCRRKYTTAKKRVRKTPFVM